MQETKPWYLSRTIWASLLGAACALAGLGGLTLEGPDQPALADALLQTISAAAGLVAILGRLSATERIG